jgi:hypothetical protein
LLAATLLPSPGLTVLPGLLTMGCAAILQGQQRGSGAISELRLPPPHRVPSPAPCPAFSSSAGASAWWTSAPPAFPRGAARPKRRLHPARWRLPIRLPALLALPADSLPASTRARGGAHLFLISAAMVMKACSTLVAFLADVSRKGMPISSANACGRRGEGGGGEGGRARGAARGAARGGCCVPRALVIPPAGEALPAANARRPWLRRSAV